MIFIILISIILYIVAIVMTISNLYSFEKNEKIKFITIGLIVVLIITFIIVEISSIGIRNGNNNHIIDTKTTSILLFAPINLGLILPYVANLKNKEKQKQLDSKKLKKKIMWYTIIIVVCIIIEISYIKGFQVGLLSSVKNK